jgi:adenylate cyclase
MPPKLTVPAADGPVEVICREVTTIGRVKPNDVVIPDPRVSRSHAMVRMLGDGRFYVMDVGSANGTFVNGQRIVMPRKLQDGDEIRVGGQSIAFCDETPPPAATEPDTRDGDSQDSGSSGSRTVLTMGGVLSHLTVLVIDVRGSTTLSAQLPPEQLASVMGSLFNEATRAVQAHAGVVDKFIGDAVMARWNARDRNVATTVIGALRAARDVQRALGRINAGCTGLPCPLRIGCGVNSGPAVLGTIGANARREYTAIGDAINLAFRFETASKELGADVVVGYDSCQHLPADFWQGHLTSIRVKGKTAPQEVWPLAFAELDDVLARMEAPTATEPPQP